MGIQHGKHKKEKCVYSAVQVCEMLALVFKELLWLEVHRACWQPPHQGQGLPGSYLHFLSKNLTLLLLKPDAVQRKNMQKVNL